MEFLRSLTTVVVWLVTDAEHLNSNPGRIMFEWRFIFQLPVAMLTLEVIKEQ